MLKRLKKLYRDESGAVTVDWVVLTAFIVGLTGVVVLSIQGGSGSVGDGVGNHLSNITPG